MIAKLTATSQTALCVELDGVDSQPNTVIMERDRGSSWLHDEQWLSEIGRQTRRVILRVAHIGQLGFSFILRYAGSDAWRREGGSNWRGGHGPG